MNTSISFIALQSILLITLVCFLFTLCHSVSYNSLEDETEGHLLLTSARRGGFWNTWMSKVLVKTTAFAGKAVRNQKQRA